MRAGISIPIRTVSFIGFYLPTSSIFQFHTGGVLFTFQTAPVPGFKDQRSKIKDQKFGKRRAASLENPESSDAVDML